MKKLVFIAFAAILLAWNGYSQNINISGTVNYYLKVDSVLSDRVRVVTSSDLNSFTPGDIILLIQMTGAAIGIPDLYSNGNISAINGAGKYEILQIDDIATTGGRKYVVFTHNLNNTYDVGEKIQLVRFVTGETVTITGNISAKAWNDSIGGIVAIIGTDSVKMKAGTTITVTGQGFKGALPESYTAGCWNQSPNDTSYFLNSQLNRAGRKGDGITTVTWPYTKGWGSNINGGGGGNRQYAGGAGGSNFRTGGVGGFQSCGTTQNSKGGFSGNVYYKDVTKKLVFMGGGGGSGVFNSSAGKTASTGGNGGGIIFLITGTFQYNNTNSLTANGADVTAGVNGSGAGGGGGGAILMDVTNYVGNSLNINIKGGKGGNTISNSPCTGSGGGGGGGIFWHAMNIIPAGISIDSSYGSPGGVAGTCGLNSGGNGGYGGKQKNLILPLTGFLFNSIHGVDTICAGTTPDLLTGSQPKGGDGTYTYKWEQSLNGTLWVNALGTGTLTSFQANALSQITYFRRIVNSSGTADTSKAINIYVYQAITGNTITGTDTICSGNHAQLISGQNGSGGDGPPYLYQWLYSDNQVNWFPAGSSSTSNNPLDPGVLTALRYYKRIISAFCIDTSNIVTVTALPVIANNNFLTGDLTICRNQSPGALDAKQPGGGDGNFSYQWQKKSTTGVWQSIAGSNVMQFNPGILTDTTKYRRIVYSGNGNACKDTMSGLNYEIKTVNVLAPVTNNTINGAPVQYVCSGSAKSLTGSQPVNGDGTYAYLWEQSADNNVWQEASGTQKNFTTPQGLTSKTYFRRNVYSSAQDHQCSSTSSAVEVRINPLPAGDVVENKDTICAGEGVHVNFEVLGSGPFDITVGDGVLNKDTLSFSPNSIYLQPASTATFRMISIQDDSSCYADANGFVNIFYAKVYNYPVANAGPDAEVCGENYTLGAHFNISGSTGLWTAPDVMFDNPQNPNSMVTAGSFGPHIFTWTETNWQCPDNDDVTVTFYEPPAAPDAGPDQVLDFSYTTQLEAITPIVGSGNWTVVKGSGDFNDSSLPDATVSELGNDNLLRWTVTNGTCPSVKDSLEITVNPLVVPKGFTPNGDGKNDDFVINAPNAEKISLKIYNSVGTLVFESDDYQQGKPWNGKSKTGVDLPEGTYFYIMNVKVAGKEKILQYKSFVEILR